MGVPRSWRTTSASRTADAWSAHCRSSRTSRRPPGLAASASRRRTSANARSAGRRRNRRRRPEPGARRPRTQPTTGRHGTGRQRRGWRARPAPAATGRTAANCPGRPPGPRHRHTHAAAERGSLLRQPGFSDSRLARAQHQPPAARQGIIQEQRDPSQLAVTADHHLGRIALHRATINGREASCIGSSTPRTCTHGRV